MLRGRDETSLMAGVGGQREHEQRRGAWCEDLGTGEVRREATNLARVACT